MSYYREQLEQWLKTIKVKTARVVDIGGASNPAKKRIGSWEAQDVTYLDNGAEEAKEDYLLFDLNLPLEEQRNGYPESFYQFGAVFCLEVFEYIWNPVRAIKNIYDLMNDDSVAYISFPAIYPVHNPVEIDSLRYTRQVIERYLKMQGFTQIEITARVATIGSVYLGEFYSAERMHPLKNSGLPFDIGYLVKARKLAIA